MIDLVDKLRFSSQRWKHALSYPYEAKIKNMGSARRNGGEYNTPRPLVPTIIKVLDPKIGEGMYGRRLRLGRLSVRGRRLPAAQGHQGRPSLGTRFES